MNMILLMHGYPIAIIRKSERLPYISALEKAQLGGSKNDYLKLITKTIGRSLDIYLKALRGDTNDENTNKKLLKIGELAEQTGEKNSTIRHWTKEGLLKVAKVTDTKYQLYSPTMIDRIKKIHALKKKRYTLKEIKNII